MNVDVLKYTVRGVIRYLNNDVEEFKTLQEKAIKADKNMFLIEDLITKDVKRKLYEMVS